MILCVISDLELHIVCYLRKITLHTLTIYELNFKINTLISFVYIYMIFVSLEERALYNHSSYK